MTKPDDDPVIAALLAKITARTAKARILLDQGLLADHAALEADLQRAITYDAAHNEEPTSPAVAGRLLELEDRMAAEEEEFVFEGVGTTAWYELVAAHPAPRGSKADHDWRTFRPAAVAASCTSHELTAASAAALMAALPESEWGRIWGACLEANLGADARPKSVLASTVRQLSGSSPTTPSLGASLSGGSLAGPGGPSRPTSTTPPDA